jgi:hypothetical protein
MKFARIMLVEAGLLNGAGDVRPHQSEVLEAVGEVAVHQRINDGITNVGGELCMCVDQSGGGMEVEHASSLEDVRGVLHAGATRKAWKHTVSLEC